MADIARMAGVSISTVSRALAGNTLIPQPLREQIVEIARTSGYVVNQAARSLRLRRTETIGVVIPLGHESGQMISDPFFLEMVGRLADEITLRDYAVLLTKVASPQPGWLERIIQSQRADGLLIIGQSNQHDALNLAAETYGPLVVWGGHLPDQRYCTVGGDNVGGARLAVEHLARIGRRRIAFLGAIDAPEAILRREGYDAALAEAGLAAHPELAIQASFTSASAHEATKALIASGAPFDAIFAISDVVALAAIRALTEAGRRVPEDVAVIGYDDIALAGQGAPPLTTVRQDLEDGARRMVDLLFRRIAGENAPSAVLPAELVIRATAV